MTDMRAGAAAPTVSDLINSGVDYAKSAKAAIPYAVAALGAMVLPAILGPKLGGVLGFVCGVATLFVAMMAAREAITGEFGYRDSDPIAVLKLIGVCILIGIVIMIVSIPLAMLIAGGVVGIAIFSLLLLAIVVALVSRIAFLLPALAMNDPISIQSMLAQTAPYWTTLILLFVATALPNVLLSALFGGVGGFFGVLIALIGAVISVALGLVSIGAVSRLYGQRARSA